MAKDVIMPALGMAQETGRLVRWLRAAGERVVQGEPLMEIETDKITVEIEAPASGILGDLRADAGEDIPVGQVIAVIRAQDESAALAAAASGAPDPARAVGASPVAARMAAEHNLDLAQIRPDGGRVEKADVLAYLATQPARSPVAPRLVAASPKARRLASEGGVDLRSVIGGGPGGAVIAADIGGPSAARDRLSSLRQVQVASLPTAASITDVDPQVTQPISTVWRVMAERTTQSWTSVPHFSLIREVQAERLIAWREQTRRRLGARLTFTDLLLKLVAAALRDHPRLNASWIDGQIILHSEMNIGLAVANEDGLLVPVVHQADTLRLGQIAARRQELVARAQDGKLRPDDIRGGTFTMSNLGMYGVDAFSAIINTPNAAILAIGRIAERVVPVNHQPAVRPMMILTLSCDHRVVDGARGARFLDTLASLIEEPLAILD